LKSKWFIELSYLDRLIEVASKRDNFISFHKLSISMLVANFLMTTSPYKNPSSTSNMGLEFAHILNNYRCPSKAKSTRFNSYIHCVVTTSMPIVMNDGLRPK
jgi:hypothetical protein